MRYTGRKASLLVSLIVMACGGAGEDQPGSAPAATSAASRALEIQPDHGRANPPGDPPMLGIHWARGQGPSAGSPDMTWHGGPVLPATSVSAIYWGTSWSSATFVGDKISGLDGFYSGIGSSHYAGTNTEYIGSNGQVTATVSYLGFTVDTSAAPKSSPRTSTILNEVCARIANPVTNGYYPVYVDTPRGHARYCAWHSWGSCNGTQVQFGFFFNLDGDPGCDPQDGSGSHSQGLAALANVSGHEISEAMTDPRGDGWYDSSGSENADKCAWTFGAPLLTFSNGTRWKIQGNWSNAAYDSNTGYPNSAGQNGCLSGL
jgi:hypothetical protein